MNNKKSYQGLESATRRCRKKRAKTFWLTGNEIVPGQQPCGLATRYLNGPFGSLNTERTYKWKLSGSARQSEIGILCFDWLIYLGVSYSREIEFSPHGKEVLRHSMASSLESSISFSTLLFRRNLTLPFFEFLLCPISSNWLITVHAPFLAIAPNQNASFQSVLCAIDPQCQENCCRLCGFVFFEEETKTKYCLGIRKYI